MDLVLAGKYRIERRLSETPLGVFFEARDLATSHQLTVKAYWKEDETSQYDAVLRELNEVSACGKIVHQALPNLADLLEERGRWFAVFQRPVGIPIEDFLSTLLTFPSPERMIGISFALADLLILVHSQSPPLFVGALSPSRILLTHQGPLLLSFELDSLYGKASRFPQEAFLAPERRGESPPAPSQEAAEEAADLYSLAALLCFLLTREAPQSPPYTFPQEVRNPHLSTKRAEIITRCLKADPAQRFQSVLEFKTLLEKAEEPPPPPVREKPSFLSRLRERFDETLVRIRYTWHVAPLLFIFPVLVVLSLFLYFQTIKSHQKAVLKESPILSIASGNLLQFVNTGTRETVRTMNLTLHPDQIFFLPSEDLIAAVTYSPPKILLSHPGKGKIVGEIPMGIGKEIAQVAFNPMNESLTFLSRGSSLIETVIPGVMGRKFSGHEMAPPILLEGKGSDLLSVLAIDVQGAILYAAGASRKLFFVDLATGREFSTLVLKGDPVSLVPAGPERLVVIEDSPPGLSVVSSREKAVIRRIPLPFSGIRIGAGTKKGKKMFLWDPSQSRLAVLKELGELTPEVVSLKFPPQKLYVDEDQLLLYASDREGKIHLLDLSSFKEKESIPVGGELTDFLVIQPEK